MSDSSGSSNATPSDSSSTTMAYAALGFGGGLMLSCSLLPQISRVHKRKTSFDMSYGYQVSRVFAWWSVELVARSICLQTERDATVTAVGITCLVSVLTLDFYTFHASSDSRTYIHTRYIRIVCACEGKVYGEVQRNTGASIWHHRL